MNVNKTIRLEDLAGELAALPPAASGAAAEALDLAEVAETARLLCPAATGALRASIRAEKNGLHAAVLAAGGAEYVNPRTRRSVDYAAAVHNGTSRAPPRPFLAQAVEVWRSAIAQRITRRTAEALA
jgi:hypothetical protein